MGIIFYVKPVEGGEIKCNEVQTPPNIYLYVDVGTICTAKPNQYYYFDGWLQSLNRNSSLPLESNSSDLLVKRYGTFTVNFKPFPPPPPPDYTYLLMSVIVSSVIGWSWSSIVGWFKARTQLKHLKECINQIGKLDKNAIEEKIIGYYVEGKLSEDHRQLLKDKISEYYDSVKDSE